MSLILLICTVNSYKIVYGEYNKMWIYPIIQSHIGVYNDIFESMPHVFFLIIISA